MNKQRRERLVKLAERIESIKLDLEAVRFEEQWDLDNMPESLQNSDRGQAMLTVIDQLEDAEADLDGALASVEASSE